MNGGYAKVAIAKIDIAGHMFWRGDHAIAAGAQKVDFIADERYAVTPLIQSFVDVLNKVAVAGYARWEPGKKQDIFGKTFPNQRDHNDSPTRTCAVTYQ